MILCLVALQVTGYRLVWSDEFDKSGRPDPANWRFELGFVRNQELQWYREENASVQEGHLVIEARREDVVNPRYSADSTDWRRSRQFAKYTSASLNTRGLHSWLYGRFEVRARISAKAGLWPAIWTLGIDKPWPSCGEVDLMEFYQGKILANTVYGSGGGLWNSVKTPYSQFTAKDSEWDQKFHTWIMDWDETSVKLFLDGKMLNQTDTTKTFNPDGFNPFRQPHFILLNLAIGSNGGDPSGTVFPSRYEIDYVRVYQRE
jgi:beta-glucanase (GH16 family)